MHFKLLSVYLKEYKMYTCKSQIPAHTLQHRAATRKERIPGTREASGIILEADVLDLS